MVDDQGHLIAIIARIVHADRFAHLGLLQAADPLQRVAKHFALPRELRSILQMLHLTSAAGSENRAEWLRAQRRSVAKLEHVRDGVALLYRRDPDAGALLRQGSETKHDHAVDTTDGLPVGKQIAKLNVKLGAGSQRRRGLKRYVFGRQAP